MKINTPNKIDCAQGWIRNGLILLTVCGVLAAGVIGMLILQNTGPKADKESPPKAIPRVKTTVAEVGSQQLYVKTQGAVEAHTSTQLSSLIMGRATMVSPKLKAGGDFKKGEIILEIERADYAAALARAESSLADAKLALVQEKARAEQAIRDWKKLGRGEAPDLVARRPQIVSAQARVTAEETELVKAVRDLESTTLRAPYHCRVDQAYVAFGAHINAGMRVADIYSVDRREVRVPVALSELAYLNDKEGIGSHVEVEAELAGEIKTWTGTIVRGEGKVDRATMTMYLIIEIATSETQGVEDLPPPGLFVNAAIKGLVMEQVVEIPRSALNPDLSVMIVDEESRLKVLGVQVARTAKDTVLISEGIPTGSQVVISALETPVSGMKLEIEPTSNEQD